MRTAPNVFSIEPGLDFAPVVVASLLEGRLFLLPDRADPLWLADLVLYVPTRRAAKLFEHAFVEAAGGRPVILPDIRPLAEAGDDDQLLTDTDPHPPSERLRTVSREERAFRLHPAIRDWQDKLITLRAGRGETSPRPSMAETLALADALGRLIDEMAIEGVPLSDLARVTPENFDASRFDEYWSSTREFLALAAEFWPQELEQLQAEDANEARLRVISGEAESLREKGSPHPVIIVGSTGSVRATAELMRAVSRLERGAVILPGLDQALDEADPDGAWALIGHEASSLPTRFAHPQASLKRALDIIGIDRKDVMALGRPDEALSARNRLVSEALRPAETSARWQQTRSGFPIDKALSGLKVVEAADEREEARVIALLMRQTLEGPDAHAALVTADRGLACRVVHELARLGIEAEDSAGTSLAESEQGLFTRLFLEAACLRNSASVLAFLRHPSSRFGMAADVHRRLVDALEIFICRQHRFPPTTAWAMRARTAFQQEPRPRWPWGTAFDATDQAELIRFCHRLDEVFAPFAAPDAHSTLSDQIEALTRSLDESREGADIAPEEIDRIAEILDDLARFGGAVELHPRDLREVVTLALKREVVPSSGVERRARIFGFLEARLVHADRIVIGGLNEGSVPPSVAGDPFLNRTMRLALGLQPGERRIGQSAHDFSMLAGNRDLVLTRSERVGTSPGTPSRFLKRLEAFAGLETWKKQVSEPGAALLRAIRNADDPGPRANIAPPFIVPARPRLPRTISITDFEKIRRDSYEIYARKLLGLKALNPLDPEPDGRQRGTLLHRILERFARERVEADAAIAGQRLRDIAAQEFRVLAHEPEALQFWWTAFEAIADGFVAFDARARAEGARIFIETHADWPVPLPQGEEVRITGKADRIEIDADGFASIIDYKTGSRPKSKEIWQGLSPQLPLTAALARRGGFAELPAVAGIRSIAYLPIGGSEPLVADQRSHADMSLDQVADEAWKAALADLEALAGGETGYRSRPSAANRNAGDFDHLARVGEWSLGASADDGQEEGEE